MLTLDHLTVIAPTLAEGVAHVRACLGLDVPFGTRHLYMGTHNHRLQLGGRVYLEIVARDPDGIDPGRARWFGVDDAARVRADWDAGRRLRGWVASVQAMEPVLAAHPEIFGANVPLPPEAPEFSFAIPEHGSLPLDGAAPSLIDRRGVEEPPDAIPDLGARLRSWSLSHPDPERIGALYKELAVDQPPRIIAGPEPRYSAEIETPQGMRTLT
ncbi:MAG: VOC family protein [Pseudomonadota bacterium]